MIPINNYQTSMRKCIVKSSSFKLLMLKPMKNFNDDFTIISSKMHITSKRIEMTLEEIFGK